MTVDVPVDAYDTSLSQDSRRDLSFESKEFLEHSHKLLIPGQISELTVGQCVTHQQPQSNDRVDNLPESSETA